MSDNISNELINFKNKFAPNVLKEVSGLELLKILAYPKNTDENIKKQFGALSEVNYNSLKNELENGMFDYGSGSAGYDNNFVFNSLAVIFVFSIFTKIKLTVGSYTFNLSKVSSSS